jgi:hypothetical protein
MLRPSVAIALVAALTLSGSSLLRADEVFPVGVMNKSNQVTSAGQCEGASCVPYNPARMSATNAGPYLESGLIQIKQSYEHPNFDPVRIDVRTPLLALGYSQKSFGPWAFGVLMIPTAYGKQTINGLPRRIAGRFESLYVENESTNYDVSLASAWKWSSGSVGVGMIRRSEKRSLFARRVGEDTELIRYRGSNVFYIPTLGLQWEFLPQVTFSAAYRAARTKHYRGSQKAATSEETTSPKNTAYDPAALLLSVGYEDAEWMAGLDVNQWYYGKGANKYSEGLTSNSTRADLKNVTDVGMRLGYKLSLDDRPFSFGGAIAQTKSPWGSGHYAESSDEHITGVDLGTVANVDRRSFGVFFKTTLASEFDCSASAYHSFGKREVGPAGDRPGYYQTQITGLGVSVSYSGF